jgi:predicted NAD-dependent protein-ADP-ribosyltransferase YbiA (DUF1768 family)
LTRGCTVTCTRLFCQAWADYSSFSNFVPWPCRFSVRYRATSSTCLVLQDCKDLSYHLRAVLKSQPAQT